MPWRAYRDLLVNPLSKILLLFPLLLGTFFPCAFQVPKWALAILIVMLLIICPIFYSISKKEREPYYLTIAYLLLTAVGSVSLYLISFYYCTYHSQILYDNVSITQIHEYREGNFRCTDGEVVVSMITLVRSYLSVETISYKVAPIVPSVASWNQTGDEVPAWAFRSVEDDESIPPEWALSDVHEGLLLPIHNEEPLLRSAVRTAAQKYNLITSATAPILIWGPFAATFLSRSMINILNILIYVCLGVLFAVSLYFHLHKLHLRYEVEKEYLLEDAKTQPPPAYGTVSKVSFY